MIRQVDGSDLVVEYVADFETFEIKPDEKYTLLIDQNDAMFGSVFPLIKRIREVTTELSVWMTSDKQTRQVW